MAEGRPSGWGERFVVTAVLAFALAAVAFALVLIPLYREVVTLRQDNATLRRDLIKMHREMSTTIARLERRLELLSVETQPPALRTKVVDVRPGSGYAALGAGKNSGVREGRVFLIYRSDEYLGKVRITTVWDDFSGGKVLESKKPFATGDDACTDTAVPAVEAAGAQRPVDGSEAEKKVKDDAADGN